VNSLTQMKNAKYQSRDNESYRLLFASVTYLPLDHNLEVYGKNFSNPSPSLSSNKNEFTFNYQNAPQKPDSHSYRHNTRDENDSSDGPLAKEEIFHHLKINPQLEQVSDFQSRFTDLSSVRSKKEVRDDVIETLEKEIQKLKYKRDNYIAVEILESWFSKFSSKKCCEIENMNKKRRRVRIL